MTEPQVPFRRIAVFGAIASFAVKDISFAWKLIISVTAGVGSVYVARWYWWRVNAWSEITAMAAALLSTFVLAWAAGSHRFGTESWVRFPYSTALTVLVSTPLWIAVTLATKPVSHAHLVRFYERCHPGGAGWRVISRDLPSLPRDGLGPLTALKIVFGVAALYLALIGIGHLVMGRFASSAALLAGAGTRTRQSAHF